MEAVFFTFTLLFSCAAYSFQANIRGTKTHFLSVRNEALIESTYMSFVDHLYEFCSKCKHKWTFFAGILSNVKFTFAPMIKMCLEKHGITIKCIAWSIFQYFNCAGCRHIFLWFFYVKLLLIKFVRFWSLLDKKNLQTHFYYDPSAAFQPPTPKKYTSQATEDYNSQSHPSYLSDCSCWNLILASKTMILLIFRMWAVDSASWNTAPVEVPNFVFFEDIPTDWDDVVVTREGSPATLICTDTTARGGVTINWKVKTIGADSWKLVLSASKTKELLGSAFKASMRLIDPNSQDTGDFSLFFHPQVEDCGLYSCMVKQQERILKETVILLAVLTGKKKKITNKTQLHHNPMHLFFKCTYEPFAVLMSVHFSTERE